MPPNNLRAVVAQMYRSGSRQSARNLCSSLPGEGVIATGLKSRDSSLVPKKKRPSFLSWVVAGYTVNFVLSTMMVIDHQLILKKRRVLHESKREQVFKPRLL